MLQKYVNKNKIQNKQLLHFSNLLKNKSLQNLYRVNLKKSRFNFQIISLDYALLTDLQLSSIESVLLKYESRLDLFIIHNFHIIPIHQKPKSSQMGKGMGFLVGHCYVCKPHFPIISFRCTNKKILNDLTSEVKKKLSIKAALVSL